MLAAATTVRKRHEVNRYGNVWLLMAVVDVVPSLAVTRVLAISFFVQLTVVANDANLKDVQNQQWEARIFAQPMAVVVGALLKAVISRPSLRQNSV